MLTVEQIQAVVADYFRDKPVKKVWLFGSYARGEADDESDIDLLVDLDYEKRLGFQFFGWPEELQQHLNMKVDVVSSRGLSEFIAPFIHKEKKLIYAA